MVVMPWPVLVITPVVELMVATRLSLLLHVPFVDALVAVVVLAPAPKQRVLAPPMVAAGVALTVMDLVAAEPQPLS